MDVLEAIARRRSIRKYTGEHISEAKMDVLVRAGQDAKKPALRVPRWEFLFALTLPRDAHKIPAWLRVSRLEDG